MNKSELVDHVALQLRTSKSEAERVVDQIVTNISQALQQEANLTITGFGTFLVRTRKARTGRNPQTGEPIQIKAGKNVAFRAGKALKGTI